MSRARFSLVLELDDSIFKHMRYLGDQKEASAAAAARERY